ncbi:FAD-dependent oxidoreductase [Tenggerimyces flavus]|uniref:D-amino-acid oxidase n=1 Tax=Tenggerimyces flavus TaxID=1708749 RepID=A0ABV7Y364_9ACTN|nr:FAD-dependent oxidoreductase [Tenggerimyces flavus]MBM7790520.1 D-amino-acid oxidase [Tenggerimyces flavus]
MTRVLVVGAGVVGLTCAIRLAEAGYEVDVFARDLPLETTSAVAPALWYPYRAFPHVQVTAWSARSMKVYAGLADEAPGSGVRMRWGTELFGQAAPDPWWIEAVPKLSRVASPREGYVDGWRFESPVIDTPTYLPWLVERLESLGGTVTRMAFSQLPDRAPILLNCTGLASRHFANDRTVTPVRGQVVVVEQVGLTEWMLAHKDRNELTMIVPRENDIVLGGTADEGDWEPDPRPETTAAIRERAAALVPQLASARVITENVGLRPTRPSVRLEAERVGAQLRVHCYGTGGSGYTIAWGCADEVLALVQDRTTR